MIRSRKKRKRIAQRINYKIIDDLIKGFGRVAWAASKFGISKSEAEKVNQTLTK
jgi:hypothetical protein